MACKNCNSIKILFVSAKCSDRCHISSNTEEHDGYVPEDIGIGGCDYIEFAYCGMIQGEFPVKYEFTK